MLVAPQNDVMRVHWDDTLSQVRVCSSCGDHSVNFPVHVRNNPLQWHNSLHMLRPHVSQIAPLPSRPFNMAALWVTWRSTLRLSKSCVLIILVSLWADEHTMTICRNLVFWNQWVLIENQRWNSKIACGWWISWWLQPDLPIDDKKVWIFRTAIPLETGSNVLSP